MSGINTKRRSLYLTSDIDQWLKEHSEDTGVKANTLIMNALSEYKDNHSKSKIRQNKELDERVKCILMKELKKLGLA